MVLQDFVHQHGPNMLKYAYNRCPKFGTSLVSTAYGAYLDHADAQNLAKPPFMRICREFENWRDLCALSGKFLRQKSCYPESFRFLRLCKLG